MGWAGAGWRQGGRGRASAREETHLGDARRIAHPLPPGLGSRPLRLQHISLLQQDIPQLVQVLEALQAELGGLPRAAWTRCVSPRGGADARRGAGGQNAAKRRHGSGCSGDSVPGGRCGGRLLARQAGSPAPPPTAAPAACPRAVAPHRWPRARCARTCQRELSLLGDGVEKLLDAADRHAPCHARSAEQRASEQRHWRRFRDRKRGLAAGCSPGQARTMPQLRYFSPRPPCSRGALACAPPGG